MMTRRLWIGGLVYLMGSVLSCGARTELSEAVAPTAPADRSRFVGRWTGSLQTFRTTRTPFCNGATRPDPDPREFFSRLCTAEVQPAENAGQLWAQVLVGTNELFSAAVADGGEFPRHFLRVQTSLLATFIAGFSGYDAGGTVIEEFTGTMSLEGDMMILQLCYTTGLVGNPLQSPRGLECRLRRIR